tara:strand:- start:596 stop:2356 length:1761 start_codon:yes stop_codon:yes gene_type:complete
MADRYQRYESKGLALKMPTVDFTFEKNRSNNLSNLSSNLDRMAQTFYSNAVQTAKIEGAEYGALNAPTEQQLLDASESNTELDFVGNNDSVFGRYARTATLEATSDKLTLMAKQSMSSIILKGKMNSTDPSEVAKELDSVTSGLSDVLDNESPVTAKKFKATMGIYANAEYKTYASKYITDKQAEFKTTWTLNFDSTVNVNLPKLIEAGITTKIPTDIKQDGKTVYKNEQVVTTKEVLQKIKDKLFSTRPVGTTSAEILARSLQFDKAVLQSAKDIVNEAVFKNEDPYKMLKLIKDNKLEKLPLSVRSAFSVVGGEDKNLLKKVAQDAYDDSIKEIETKISHQNILRQENIRIVEINASTALLNSNSAQAVKDYEKETDLMLKLDIKKYKEMRDLLKENPTLSYALYSSGATFDKVSRKFDELNVDLTQSELNTFLLNKKLSKDDFNEFTKKLSARSDKEFNRALTDARSRLKVPVSILGNSAVMKSWQFNTLKNIEEGMYRARRTDPAFIASKWLDDNYLSYKENGEVTELDILKELGGDYLNLDYLNKLINKTPDGARKTKFIEDKNRILNWNSNNPNKQIKGF